jgi:hypothetical protein
MGHRNMIKLLLESSGDLQHLHQNFTTTHPLEILPIKQKMGILLDCGAQIMAFHSSIEAGHVSAVSSALANGMKTDVPGGEFKYALHNTANTGNLTIVSLLLERSNNELDIADPVGQTPLWLAARGGYLHVLDKLSELGTIDVNAQSCAGKTSLWWPSAYGHVNVVEWLLSKNADPHIITG